MTVRIEEFTMRTGIVCAALGGLLWTATWSGAAEAPAVKKEGPQAQQFSQIFTEWKETLSKMRQLHEEDTDAKPERRKAIKKEYDELLKKGAALEPKLFDAAEKAYVEAPNANPDLLELLMAIAKGLVSQEQYEDALRWTELLAKHDCPHAEFYSTAGIAAFATGNFEDAGKYLLRAAQHRMLTNTGQPMLESAEEYKSLWAKEQKIRAAEAKSDDLPRVLLKTSKGDIEIELFENEAPDTVANFISLVEKGFYNGLPFHRVLSNFMAQGGCPKGDGSGGPGYDIACECHQPNYRKHFRGSLSMAHAGRDTGGSQFFLTFLPTTHLNGKHTCFGRVVKGFEVLARIQRRNPDSPHPPTPDRIVEAKVLRKRPHAYEPKTNPGNR